MATSEDATLAAAFVDLDSTDWSCTLQAIAAAERTLRSAIEGDAHSDKLAAKIAGLADHAKWEVRRAVANVAAYAPHSLFDPVLARLRVDDNGRVRHAAEHAALRRRDSRNTSALGRQHETRINATLDDIEARFGARGREAVKRAAEHIADTFSRELYHEIIKLLTPLAASADRLMVQLSSGAASAEAIADESRRIRRRVEQLRAVLDAMRAYTIQPVLLFRREALREIVDDATHVAFNSMQDPMPKPGIDIDVAPELTVEVVRSRLAQALTNVLINAIESYHGVDSCAAIRVSAESRDGVVTISVEDHGCGMSDEAQRDALTLFATSKPHGTGVGLPLAVKIVEAEHGGHLQISSRKGVGTMVRIALSQYRQGDRR